MCTEFGIAPTSTRLCASCSGDLGPISGPLFTDAYGFSDDDDHHDELTSRDIFTLFPVYTPSNIVVQSELGVK